MPFICSRAQLTFIYNPRTSESQNILPRLLSPCLATTILQSGGKGGNGGDDTGALTEMTASLPEYDLSKFTPLPCKAGALVLIHGAVVHMSYPNRSPRSRHAYSVHCVEGAEPVVWEASNWLQREAFEPLYDDSAAKGVSAASDDRQAYNHAGAYDSG